MSERDEKGRLLPGHKGSNQHSKFTADSPNIDTPPFSGDFDDAVIYVAETYEGKPRSFVGLLAVVEDLRRNKAADFAAYLKQAYANRKEKQSDINTGGPSVLVSFASVPPGTFYNPETRCLEDLDTAKAEWEEKTGATATIDEPPPPRPTLVHPTPDYDEPPYTVEEVSRMSKEEFDAAVAAGEIVIIDRER